MEFSQQSVIQVNDQVLLHAAKLGHGTDSFTCPPEEGMLRIFTPVKIQRLRPGLNPQTWVPEASMLTTRPPKPSQMVLYVQLHATVTLFSAKEPLADQSIVLVGARSARNALEEAGIASAKGIQLRYRGWPAHSLAAKLTDLSRLMSHCILKITCAMKTIYQF